MLHKIFAETVCEKLPSPTELSASRVERLMLTHNRKFTALPPASQVLKDAFLNCSCKNEAPIIVCVSKMFAVDAKSLPENRPKPLTHEEMLARREQARQKVAEKLAKVNINEEITDLDSQGSNHGKDDNDNSIVNSPQNDEEKHKFIAFSRVYSGTIKRGSTVYVLGPKHDPVTIFEKVQFCLHMVTFEE